MQLTIVNAEPLLSEGAVCATSVENCGESMMTTMPHIRRNKKIIAGFRVKINGDMRQQKADAANAKKATL